MASNCLWDGTLSPDDFQIAAKNLIDKWAACCPTSQPWRWEPCPKLPWGASHSANGYLSLEDVIVYNPNEQHNVADSKYEFEEGEEPSDPATLVKSNHGEAHLYTLHIVYNASYKVPILLFRGHAIDGKPLEFKDIQKDLSSDSCQLLEASRWTFLTQEEHPYLNQPWYVLHPCGTSKWMTFLFSSEINAPAATMVEHSLVETERVLQKQDNGSKLMEEITDSLISSNKINYMLPIGCNSLRRDIICQYLIAWLSVVGQIVGLRIPFEIVKISSHKG